VRALLRHVIKVGMAVEGTCARRFVTSSRWGWRVEMWAGAWVGSDTLSVCLSAEGQRGQTTVTVMQINISFFARGGWTVCGDACAIGWRLSEAFHRELLTDKTLSALWYCTCALLRATACAATLRCAMRRQHVRGRRGHQRLMLFGCRVPCILFGCCVPCILFGCHVPCIPCGCPVPCMSTSRRGVNPPTTDVGQPPVQPSHPHLNFMPFLQHACDVAM